MAKQINLPQSSTMPLEPERRDPIVRLGQIVGGVVAGTIAALLTIIVILALVFVAQQLAQLVGLI